jgi:hypothetical protein
MKKQYTKQHTPGPWSIDTYLGVVACGRIVALTGIDAGFHRDANARLIAAAPDLLEALENLLKAVEWSEVKPVHNLTTLGRAMAKAKTAIARAGAA